MTQIHRRRGMSLIVVLAVLSISVAAAFAVLRTQGTTLQLAGNTDRQGASRRAAMSGVSAAIRKMHVTSAWQGVGTSWSSSLSATESFTVAYAAGDPTLTSSHADYGDTPYRVTITSTGYAFNPAESAAVATYTIRAVMRLVPRQLATEPSGWQTLSPYSFYQWKPEGGASDPTDFNVEIPCQLEGNIRLKKNLNLCTDYPSSNVIRQRLLGDLNAMRIAGQGDHRPFTGRLYLDTSIVPQATRDLVTLQLGVPITNTSATDATVWSHPGTVSSYKIYPGGPTYTVPSVGPSLNGVTLQPNPVSNPLGMYFYPGRLYLYNNVNVQGTLVTSSGEGDIFVEGDNVAIKPVNLPPLQGTTTPVQLPVAVVRDDVRVFPGASGSIQGMMVVWDEIEFRQDDQAGIDFTLEGRVLAKELLVNGRDEWDEDQEWWQARYDAFLLSEQTDGAQLFPVWLRQHRGLKSQPRLRIKPAAAAVTYHWKNNADPIYVPHVNDPGLRWDLLSWTENP